MKRTQGLKFDEICKLHLYDKEGRSFALGNDSRLLDHICKGGCVECFRQFWSVEAVIFLVEPMNQLVKYILTLFQVSNHGIHAH